MVSRRYRGVEWKSQAQDNRGNEEEEGAKTSVQKTYIFICTLIRRFLGANGLSCIVTRFSDQQFVVIVTV